jgi:hypothetical protein
VFSPWRQGQGSVYCVEIQTFITCVRFTDRIQVARGGLLFGNGISTNDVVHTAVKNRCTKTRHRVVCS